MPKIKTHSGAAKRFKKTGSGKIVFKPANARHILTTKSTKVKRKNRGTDIMDGTEKKRISRLIPYA